MIPFLQRNALNVWFHPAFRAPIGAAGRGAMDPRRADNVLTWLLDRRIVRDTTVHSAPEISWAHARRVHDDTWLAALEQEDTIEGICGLALPVAGMLELWRRGCGGTLEATRHALQHGMAASLMGGFHHAAPASGSGFCGMNDVAIAIAAIRLEGFGGSIVVVDLDAHPPDGTAAFHLEDTSIHSVSVESTWVAEGARCIRVPSQTRDRPYLDAVTELLDGLPAADLVFYLAGSDPMSGDPLGNLDVSMRGLRERDRLVFQAIKGTPSVVLPAGGYTKDAWKSFAHTLARAAGHKDEVDAHYDPVSRRVGRVARSLANFPEELEITEADLGGLSPVPTERRFLGHYTRHGLEFVLSRYGILGAVSRMGFENIELTIDTSSSPHRLWILADHPGGRDRIAEVALRIRTFESWRVLFIDWLELKDPRVPAGPRALPGQSHPGLGLAKEVLSMLGVAAERLHLSGLAFIPSHYHVAWMARKLAMHTDPGARGHFKAYRQVLAGMSLGKATRLLEGPGLPTEDGNVLRWEPSWMVHALEPELHAHLARNEDEMNAIRRRVRDYIVPPPA